jgi:hypothetical protein
VNGWIVFLGIWFLVSGILQIGASYKFAGRVKSTSMWIASAYIAFGVLALVLAVTHVQIPQLPPIWRSTFGGLLFGVLSVLGIVYGILFIFRTDRYLRLNGGRPFAVRVFGGVMLAWGVVMLGSMIAALAPGEPLFR